MNYILIIFLVLLGILYGIYYFINALKNKENLNIKKKIIALTLGSIANFFDTLGIGSFAIMLPVLKYTKLVDTKVLPGTLNVSTVLPIICEGIIMLNIIKVDFVTLIVLVVFSSLGSYISAGVISKLSKAKINLIIGIGLLLVAFFMFLKVEGIINSFGGGNAIGLSGIKLVIGAGIFFIIGMLNAIGVGSYAPSMATILLLGMNPLAAFPIMTLSTSFLQALGSAKYIKQKQYSPSISLLITISGIVGVILASRVIEDIKNININFLTYIVIIIVSITAFIMILENKKLEKKK